MKKKMVLAGVRYSAGASGYRVFTSFKACSLLSVKVRKFLKHFCKSQNRTVIPQ